MGRKEWTRSTVVSFSQHPNTALSLYSRVTASSYFVAERSSLAASSARENLPSLLRREGKGRGASELPNLVTRLCCSSFPSNPSAPYPTHSNISRRSRDVYTHGGSLGSSARGGSMERGEEESVNPSNRAQVSFLPSLPRLLLLFHRLWYSRGMTEEGVEVTER